MGICNVDHDRNLANFMCRSQHKGIKLNSQKPDFKCKEVPFHGHLLTTEGLKPDPEKVRAITEMPRPENRHDVLRLNGRVTFRMLAVVVAVQTSNVTRLVKRQLFTRIISLLS